MVVRSDAAHGQRSLDRFFRVEKLGCWQFTLLAWIDHFSTWANELKKRITAQNNPDASEATLIGMRD